MKSREWRNLSNCFDRVVVANDRNIFGDSKPGSFEHSHCADRGFVVAG